MATSPLFGWEEPDDTDLVKDGAAAIRTLGNAIDTSMGDLLGGTTGQVLSKNSNTNMDFTWVAQDDSNAIQNAIVDAKGDLIAATAADTPARLAVGTNGQYLQADSTAATGLKWATASGASYTWTAYTPTYNNFTLGNGTQTFKYLQIDKIVFVLGKITLGSTSSVTGNVGISCPVTEGIEDYITTFTNSYYDVSVATQYGGLGRVAAGFIQPQVLNASATYSTELEVNATIPFTWTTSDIMIIAGWYQAS